MNRERLEQLEDLKQEIKVIYDTIDKLERGVTHTYVKGSRRRIPFDVQYITVTGLRGSSVRKLEQKKTEYSQKLDDLQVMVDELEEWIDTIPDSLMRSIVRLRYRNGMSWQQVAASIGGRNTADSVRMAHNRFFEKI